MSKTMYQLLTIQTVYTSKIINLRYSRDTVTRNKVILNKMDFLYSSIFKVWANQSTLKQKIYSNSFKLRWYKIVSKIAQWLPRDTVTSSIQVMINNLPFQYSKTTMISKIHKPLLVYKVHKYRLGLKWITVANRFKWKT